jgi:S1-C subfamily serine protease
VKVQLRILTGARKGVAAAFSKNSIEIGRHPDCDLQFDPDDDLEVSGKHAILVEQGGRWYVRDLESLNGTFLNGHPVTSDTQLDDTDQIRFGAEGPTIEFRLVPEHTPDGIVEPSEPVSPTAPREPIPATAPGDRSEPPAQPARESGTTERIRIEVGRQTKKLRRLTVMLFVVLLAVVAIFIVDSTRQRRLRDRDVAATEARTDSIIRAANDAVAALQGEVEGLATALRTSREEVGNLRTALVEAERSGSADEVARLRRQLADASQALLYQQAAAYVDYRSILDANQNGVALMWVEFTPGDVVTGTAFAVWSDGTMLTSGHAVSGAEGTRRPTRIAIKFADSYQVYRGRVLAVSSDADIAAIKVDVPGGVPTVRGLSQRPDTLRQGDPVAVIGFPLGPDLPMSAYGRDRTIARTTFSAGSVSKVLSDVIQLDGYGAEGSSGSPILDQNGEVVGVVYGGQTGSDGRVVLGVPSSVALRLLETLR